MITFFLKVNNNFSIDNLNKTVNDFELFDLQDKFFSQLSFGQQQRVKFVVSLLKPFKILILDEIFSGLDSYWKNKIKKIMLDLKQKGATVLLISHEIDEIVELSDRVLHFEKGKIVSDFVLQGTKTQRRAKLLKNVSYLLEGE